MAERRFAGVLRQIRRLIDAPAGEGLTDGQLVDRFAASQDQAAFELLLHRHGPMVLNVCRFWLRDPHDIDDAFQATFLVLARKASSIHKRSSAASWLYGVAQRVARQARVNAARRRRKERQAADMAHVEPPSELGQNEMHSLLRDELQRLPEKYRAPLILCYLEGKTNETAAQELGVPSGSMSKRLTQARDLLRERLMYRGAALSVGGCAALLSETTATAAVPPALLTSTLQVASLFAAGSAVAGAIPQPVAALAEGALHTMRATQLKILAAVVLALTFVGGGIGMFALHIGAAPSAKEAPVRLPDDPQAVVVRLDLGDTAADKEPQLTIRGDSTAIFGNPRGDSQRIEAKLPAAELQELLRQVVREHGFFDCDSRR